MNEESKEKKFHKQTSKESPPSRKRNNQGMQYPPPHGRND